MSNKVSYWVSAAGVCVFSLLPYVSDRLFAYSNRVDFYDVAFAVGWGVSLAVNVYYAPLAGIKRWWLALSAPVALFRVAEVLLMIVFFIYWRLSGRGL